MPADIPGSLSAFIQAHHREIIAAFSDFARTLMPVGSAMTLRDLEDHCAELLRAVADDLAREQTVFEQSEKGEGRGTAHMMRTSGQLHADGRFAHGFTLAEVFSEFRALRASVLRLYEQSGHSDLAGLRRFNEAIDEAVAESAARYSTLQRVNEDRFRTLVERSPFGTYVVDSELRITMMNTSGQQGAFVNVRPVIGRPLEEAMRILWPEDVAREIVGHFRGTLASGTPFLSKNFVRSRSDTGQIEGYEWELHRVLMADGAPGVICYYYDATRLRDTERQLQDAVLQLKQRAESGAFLAELSEGLSGANDPATLMQTAGAMLAAHLKLASVQFGEVDEEHGVTRVLYGWHGPESRSPIGGVYRHDDYMSTDLLEANRRGEVLVVTDTLADARTDPDSFRRIGICAFVTVPFRREGRWQFTLAVTDVRPRTWVDVEVALIREAANRIFPKLERARAEEALRQQAELIRSVNDNTGELIYTKDLSGRLTYANAATLRVMGMTQDEALASSEHQRFRDDQEMQEIASNDRRVEESGQTVVVEERFSGADGTPRVYLSTKTPQRDAAGRIIGVIGVSRDITERKQAEHDLQRSEAIHRRLAEANLFGVGFGDSTGHVSYVNDEMLRMMGRTRADFEAGRINWEECIAPECRELMAQAMRRALTEGQSSGHESAFLRPDGERTPYLGAAALVNAGEDFHVSIALDLTKVRAAEHALKDADRRKDEFLATLAHELRNPLAPIRTGLEMLRLTGNTPASLGRVRSMMERQVAHMVRLIDDLLDVSRITSGKIRLQRRPSALAELVSSAIDANRALIAAGQLHLDVRLPDRPPIIDVDPTRFVQVLSNLLHNATKFTPAHGRIEVAADVLPGSGQQPSPELRLRVTDTGVGISAEMLPHVFELFAQDEPDVARSHEGLGIGLALARRLMEMHGGTILARSAGRGRGSEFVLQLPFTETVDVSATQEAHKADATVTRRVVVIDDNRDAADTLAAWIDALGGQTRTAHDGASGVVAVREFHPDVVLLDIGMPGMDGYETCRRIRAEHQGQEIAIVALTGWGQDHDKQRAQDAGFDAHLTKPADPATLEALLIDDGAVGKAGAAGR